MRQRYQSRIPPDICVANGPEMLGWSGSLFRPATAALQLTNHRRSEPALEEPLWLLLQIAGATAANARGSVAGACLQLLGFAGAQAQRLASSRFWLTVSDPHNLAEQANTAWLFDSIPMRVPHKHLATTRLGNLGSALGGAAFECSWLRPLKLLAIGLHGDTI